MLDDPPVDDARLVEHGDVDLSTGWGSEERAGVGSAATHAHPHEVPVDHGVVNAEGHVRHRPVDVPDRGLQVGDGFGARTCEPELVLHEIWGAQLVDDGVVADGEPLVKHAVHDIQGRVTCLHCDLLERAWRRPHFDQVTLESMCA